jgi:cytidylate kinase
MDQKMSSYRLAEAMDRTRRQWQARRKAEGEAGIVPSPAPAAFSVALTREAGANGPAVARAVGERLGWPVYDRELLDQVAAEMGLRARLLEEVDERRKPWLHECLESLTSARAVTSGGYVRHLVEAFLALAAHGECVLVGRGAAQALPAGTTLRVRLVGLLEDRVEAVRQRFGIPREEAARWVQRTDAERDSFVREHFRKDPADPRLYDLVLNSSRFPAGECADLVVEALRRLQGRARGHRPGTDPA